MPDPHRPNCPFPRPGKRRNHATLEVDPTDPVIANLADIQSPIGSDSQSIRIVDLRDCRQPLVAREPSLAITGNRVDLPTPSRTRHRYRQRKKTHRLNI